MPPTPTPMKGLMCAPTVGSEARCPRRLVFSCWRPWAVRGEEANAFPRVTDLGENVRPCPDKEEELPPRPALDSRNQGSSPWPLTFWQQAGGGAPSLAGTPRRGARVKSPGPRVKAEAAGSRDGPYLKQAGKRGTCSRA